MCVWERESVCGRESDGRERECVGERERVFGRERECVCVGERVIGRESVGERESVWKRVCGRECVEESV